jgi:UDP-N-acetylglucosamine 4-epimerase
LVRTPEAIGQVYNVAVGGRTTLNELHDFLAQALSADVHGLKVQAVTYGPFRSGDVMHSQADISKARRLLEYTPVFDVRTGLLEAAR